jgi:hypothetical protein
MKESGAEILKAYHDIPKRPSGVKGEEIPETYDLRKFVETYITSISNIIRAFPTSNLDINALEAHYWDRLRYFYNYDKFKEVKVEKKEEIRFINLAIRTIEDWFHDGSWTSCLTAPTDAEIQKMLTHGQSTFLKRVRDMKDTELHPNLGRDGRDYGNSSAGKPEPDIYAEIASGADPRDVYLRHAFKFFHGPAAVLNTLTKVSTREGVVANRERFENFIKQVILIANIQLRRWGYRSDDPEARILKDSERNLNGQADYLKRCTRTLFFMKTCLEGAEIMRRTGHPRLTKEDFQRILSLIKAEQERQKADKEKKKVGDSEDVSTDLILFNFSPTKGFEGSTMHVNAVELPLALIAVDYLRSLYDKRQEAKS